MSEKERARASPQSIGISMSRMVNIETTLDVVQVLNYQLETEIKLCSLDVQRKNRKIVLMNEYRARQGLRPFKFLKDHWGPFYEKNISHEERTLAEAMGWYSAKIHECLDADILRRWLVNLSRIGKNPDRCLSFLTDFFDWYLEQKAPWARFAMGNLNHIAAGLGPLGRKMADKAMAATEVSDDAFDGITREQVEAADQLIRVPAERLQRMIEEVKREGLLE